jgi:hypothetical protein
MSNETPNPKRILDDLARELDGDCLEDTFTWKGRKFKIKLLNEEESNWRNGFVNMGSGFATLTSWRLPTLAIGIREIDDTPVFEFFRSEWESTEKGREVVRLMEGRGTFSMKYFSAEHLMQFLGRRPPEALEEMWKYYKMLEDRREEAQDNVKKSSGEGSVKGEKPSGTESSPSGEE